MEWLAHLLIPHEGNNHHAHLIRYPNLAIVAAFLILASFSVSLFSKGSPQVLGFATDIKVEELISLTNKEREKNGLPSLKESPVLDAAAAQKAQDMFKKDYWAHIAPDGTTPWVFFKNNSYVYSYAGENLARDFYTSSAVVAAWMKSSSHRENIVNSRYEEIGMAVVDGKLGGEDTTLVVQFFGTPSKATLLPIISSDQGAQGVGIGQQLESNGSKPVSVLPSATTAPTENSIFSGLENLGLTQKIYLGVLILLFLAFVIDSVVLYRRRIERKNSHSLMHASLIAILVFLIIIGATKGVII
ncbi:MAG: CAP domain-containing protein [Patescibacteria group bacterium]|nr:CAP domain-containing protein [Patescibacteria group bacterium]